MDAKKHHMPKFQSISLTQEVKSIFSVISLVHFLLVQPLENDNL